MVDITCIIVFNSKAEVIEGSCKRIENIGWDVRIKIDYSKVWIDFQKSNGIHIFLIFFKGQTMYTTECYIQTAIHLKTRKEQGKSYFKE